MSARSQAEQPVVPQDHEQPVDAVVVPEPPVSLELARRSRRSEVIRPLDVEQLVESFADYQALIPRLLDESDYQGTGSDRFKKKSAWRKLAAAFDLDVTLVSDDVERDEHGHPLRAKVVARAIAPSGRTMDGDGYCSADEPRFATDRGRQKLENDLRATATTRAKNRAISDLIGAGEVSAEEVDAGRRANTSDAEHPFGPALANDRTTQRPYAAAFGQLVGPEAKTAWIAIIADLGYMPKAVAEAFALAARFLPSELEEAAAV